MDQGWALVLLTSIITFLGCCVIYTDSIYSLLFPKRAERKPFHIANDTNFLICSLSLSSGCLLFTSLYKLLPRSHSYLKLLPQLHSNNQLLKLIEYSGYIGGIVLCSLLNLIIHLLTNESLVHCAHDGDHGHDESHDHGHSHNINDNDNSITESLSHSHSHSNNNLLDHSNEHSSVTGSDSSNKSQDTSVNNTSYPVTDSASNSPPDHNHQMHHNTIINETEIPPPQSKHETHTQTHINYTQMHSNNPINQPKKSLSLIDLSLKTLKGEKMTGECFGDIDCCTDNIINQNKLHKHKSNELYFCSRPTEENLLFFPNKKHMIIDKNEFSTRYPNLDIHSPLIPNSNNNNMNITDYYSTKNDHQLSNLSMKSNNHSHNNSHQYHDQTDNHSNNENDHDNDYGNDDFVSISTHETDNLQEHHHHIKTPLSRLLSIGLQTILAITLHKFPEGFIMYSTSKTNPELGMSIFLSMFIHNFVEGFTMTLPLYVALNSRFKALLIAGSLGCLSQPFGALIGYYMFHDKIDMDDPFSILLIAILLSITSGFLTFISLQMFASAISFGGKQETVLKWSFFGIFLICVSNILL